jgi:hypothetical protein
MLSEIFFELDLLFILSEIQKKKIETLFKRGAFNFSKIFCRFLGENQF